MQSRSLTETEEAMRTMAVAHLNRWPSFDLKRFMHWFCRLAPSKQDFFLTQGVIKANMDCRRVRKSRQRRVNQRSNIYEDLLKHRILCFSPDGRYLKGFKAVKEELQGWDD